ncbi:hypothetical protein DFJ74DRAFT_765966 [Hyaloraphidium curvatum]|nr:hypothetical protein DFJ74DRAFT_765966 [Hyaloraphidium curvatum]
MSDTSPSGGGVRPLPGTSPLRSAFMTMRRESVSGANPSLAAWKMQNVVSNVMERQRMPGSFVESDSIEGGEAPIPFPGPATPIRRPSMLGSASASGTSTPARSSPIPATALVNPTLLAAASKLLSAKDDDLVPSPSSPPSGAKLALDLEADIFHPSNSSSATSLKALKDMLERIEGRLARIEGEVETLRTDRDEARRASLRAAPAMRIDPGVQRTPTTFGTSPTDSEQSEVTPGGTASRTLARGTWALIVSFTWWALGRAWRQFFFFLYLRRLRKFLVVVLFNLTMLAQKRLPEKLYRYVVSPVMEIVFRIL